jgi:hypothetical protein
MKKDMMMSAEEEQEMWSGYEAWLDEQADRAAYERMVEM